MIFYSDDLITSWENGEVSLDNDRIGWVNILSFFSYTASSEQIGFSADTLKNGISQVYWRPAVMPATITVSQAELSQGWPVDYIAFAEHDLASKGVSVTLEGGDGITWENIITVTPRSDSPFVALFGNRTHANYRVTFSGTSVFSLGVMYLGSSLVMERGQNFNFPVPFMNRDDKTFPVRNQRGAFMGAVSETGGVKTTLSFSNMTSDWFTYYFKGFLDVAHYTPFFLSFMPRPSRSKPSLRLDFEDVVFADRPANFSDRGGAAFLWLPPGESISSQITQNNGRYSVSFSVMGHSYG